VNSRRENIRGYASRYLNDLDHSEHVATLAEKLFDVTEDLHQLGPEDRELLVSAALLHDIGWCDGQRAHHKRSRDIILANPPDGLTTRESVIIACVARYHRKALPDSSRREFATLSKKDQNVVKKLAALLRVADGLDYAHVGRVNVLNCQLSGNTAVIGLDCSRGCELEIAAATKKSDLFERIFGKRLVFELDKKLGSGDW
jgi:exopolyphosphatase/guanosine-5'-triphosphate,3'-diphosphate pyrophosphatase